MKKTVLIADDDESIAWVLERFFKEKGFEVSIARDGVTCARLLKETNPLITLLDINMPGKDGLAVLRGAEPSFDGAVIVMTAESTMKNAIEAMKLGAFDYLSKPVDLDELDVLTERAMRNRAIEKELGALKERLNEKLSTETTFVGKSKAVEKVFKTIGRIAPKDVPVLIQGESGTGKELVAKLIHANSPRREGPFIAVNSAAVPRELMESELFGHEKGAFTGATERRPGKFE
ncbi:MAG TPA: sigma 54-interacting transcriptional regulator, partial [Candidatus Manganitrophaceae bacterium]